MSVHKNIGRTTHVLESCDSTNDIAMDLARSGCENGTVVLAKHQLRGKGRHGRTWASWPGNLALSVVIRPQLTISESHRLVLNSALSAVAALQKLDINAFIKWPNDLLIRARDPILVDKLGPFRKVGGILLEIISTNQQVDAAIIGIGLNLVRPPSDHDGILLPQMGFVQDEKAEVTLADVLDCLLEQLELHLGGPFNEIDHDDVLAQVKDYSALLGKKVKVDFGNNIIDGIAVDLSSDGGLIVRLPNGADEKIFFGDVHLVA